MTRFDLVYVLAWHSAYQRLIQADTDEARREATIQACDAAIDTCNAFESAHVGQRETDLTDIERRLDAIAEHLGVCP